jgi:uncharacterized membrane protein
MFKIILAFLFVFGLFFFGIKVVRKMTGMEQWALTKYVLYSIVCSVLTVASLVTIVILF